MDETEILGAKDTWVFIVAEEIAMRMEDQVRNKVSTSENEFQEGLPPLKIHFLLWKWMLLEHF